MNIRDIKWPIYALSGDISSEFNVDYIEHNGKISILDNKNLSGNTLGSRRLKLDTKDLYIFKKTLFMFSELIEYTRNKLISDRKFIDSNGIIFNYTKSEYKKLIWRKIISKESFSTYKIIKVSGITNSFEIPNNYWNKVRHEDVWLGLLDFNKYYVVYDISEEWRKDTQRKV